MADPFCPRCSSHRPLVEFLDEATGRRQYKSCQVCRLKERVSRAQRQVTTSALATAPKKIDAAGMSVSEYLAALPQKSRLLTQPWNALTG